MRRVTENQKICKTMIPPSAPPPSNSSCWSWWEPPPKNTTTVIIPSNKTGCDYKPCEKAVCDCDDYCCYVAWDKSCRGFLLDNIMDNQFMAGCSASTLCCEDISDNAKDETQFAQSTREYASFTNIPSIQHDLKSIDDAMYLASLSPSLSPTLSPPTLFPLVTPHSVKPPSVPLTSKNTPTFPSFITNIPFANLPTNTISPLKISQQMNKIEFINTSETTLPTLIQSMNSTFIIHNETTSRSAKYSITSAPTINFTIAPSMESTSTSSIDQTNVTSATQKGIQPIQIIGILILSVTLIAFTTLCVMQNKSKLPCVRNAHNGNTESSSGNNGTSSNSNNNTSFGTTLTPNNNNNTSLSATPT